MQIIKKAGSLLASLLMLAAAGLIWVNRQNIYDWARLYDYEPAPRIAQLASDTTMTDLGKKLFYVHDPSLEDKVDFASHCTITEASIILGCYITHQKIYLLEVTDERLQGVHEVTAAHEMLHAAYDRLSEKERARIDALTAEVRKNLTDERILGTIKQYEERDASVVPNELHSIFGTELKELPAELEQHYSRYFSDRQKIVSLSHRYENAFTERKRKVEGYDAQLASLQNQISQAEQELMRLNEDISRERARLDALLAAEEYDQYNAAVPVFNNRVRQYNASLERARQLTAEFNRIVAERNAIALEERELLEAIDSRMTKYTEE